jgi:corrinoid protein of di/trimethylamine methyltransferase
MNNTESKELGMSNDLFAQISQSLVDGDPDATLELTQEALRQGIEPMALIKEGLMPGMEQVGERFQCGEYFLPDLIIAADGMQKAMELLEPELRARQQSIESAGTVVLGTVKGDIHEIGKSLVGTMLAANGFKVHDLGVDVPAAKFVEKVQLTGADILGMSALLTTTMTVQRDVIDALANAGLREQVKVIVGGAPVTRSWAQDIGADGYAEDAMGAVQVARKLVEK